MTDRASYTRHCGASHHNATSDLFWRTWYTWQRVAEQRHHKRIAKSQMLNCTSEKYQNPFKESAMFSPPLNNTMLICQWNWHHLQHVYKFKHWICRTAMQLHLILLLLQGTSDLYLTRYRRLSQWSSTIFDAMASLVIQGQQYFQPWSWSSTDLASSMTIHFP